MVTNEYFPTSNLSEKEICVNILANKIKKITFQDKNIWTCSETVVSSVDAKCVY